jgi:hypothetical protein
MDNKSEPSLVPQWLKNTGSGNLTAGGITSLSLSDDQGVLKSARNKSDFDRTTSSYLRRNPSSNNGSAHARSYSSFGRNQRDRDWDFNKEIYKEKSVFNDYSRANRDILPTMFEKDRLRRSQSYRGDTWQKTDINHTNGNSVLRSAHKGSFERDFPSLDNNNEIKRVPSPIQKLPISSSALISGDGWTSALAEVPAIVSGLASSAPAGASHGSALNMAETVAQLPSRTQSTPQLSVGTQRLEEIALKQSRQLIPVITSAPKPLVLSTIDKSKPKHQISSPRGVGPTIGKLQVLKLTREKNGIFQIQKDTINNNNNNINININSKNNNTPKLPNSPMKSPTYRKPAPPDKRPASNAQSRHDFFNNVRKKSMTNIMSPSLPLVPEASVNKDNYILVTNSNDADNGGSDGSDKILIPYTEEEEVSLLRSMGWDENSGEEEGLTEEEINAFCTKYANANAKLSAKVYPRMVSVKSDQGR